MRQIQIILLSLALYGISSAHTRMLGTTDTLWSCIHLL